MTSHEDKKFQRAIRSVEILTAALLTAAALFVGLVQMRDYKLDQAAVDGAYEMTVPPEVQQMVQELARRREAALNSSVEIQINGEPQVDASSGRCGLLAGNPEGNNYDFRITIKLDGSGEIIYRSPVLKPGERVAYVTLNQIPEPGSHAATAEFAVLDPESGEAVGAVDAGILLIVGT